MSFTGLHSRLAKFFKVTDISVPLKIIDILFGVPYQSLNELSKALYPML